MSDAVDFFEDEDEDDIETAKAVASFSFDREDSDDDGMGYFNKVRVLKKHDWMKTKKFVLVTTQNLTECIDACINGVKGRFALDLETTGIDNRVDELTGATKDKIVGVCLSGDGMTGWYIPLRHQNTREHPNAASHNIPFHIFDPEFRRLMAAVDEGRVVAIFHNGKFDQEFLECNGGEPYGDWSVPKNWEDTLILAYLRHSRARRKSLKLLSAASADEKPTQEQISQVGGRGLGMVMYELEDLFPKPEKGEARKYDFSLLDPSEDGPLIYGCSDGICTWLLADLLIPEVLQPKHAWNQKYIYTIEKLCVTATRWMERNRILTDPAKVMELIKLGQQEWFDSVIDVYNAAHEILGRDVMPGYYKVLLHGSPEDGVTGRFVPDDPLTLLPQQMTFAKSREAMWYRNAIGTVETRGKKWPLIYDVLAPQQLGQMFEEMAVPGLKYTEKSGQVMTKKDELDRVIDEAADRFPFMSKIKRFRETNKALSGYLYPMLEDVDPSDHTMRINFVAHKTDTGRFSTPAKERELDAKNNKRMPGWPEINLQSMPATYDPKRPAAMTRIRECIVARPGYYIIAIDFSGEELRLVTNLSGEPKWLDEFFHCSSCNRKFNRGDGATTPPPPPARCPNCGSDKIGDLHTLTALSLYGQEAPRKDNWKALRGYAKCVHPDTLIGLPQGVRPLSTLTFGDHAEFLPVAGNLQVWRGHSDPSRGMVPVKSTYNGGVKPLYHVVTRRGILTCSAEHAFVLADGSQVSLSSGLVRGMALESLTAPSLGSSEWVRRAYIPFAGVPAVEIQTTPDLAYFAGMFLGDGSKSGSTTIGISHGDVRKTDKMGIPYSQWQEILAGSCSAAGFTPVKQSESVYLGSRQVMRFLGALDLVAGVSGGRILRVPQWVMQAGREGVLRFLGGLFDTDGTVNQIDAGIAWTSKDAIFAGQVAALLHAVGCVPAVEPCWNKTYQRWYYRVHVRASEAAAVAIHMKHPGKLARLRAALPGARLANQVLEIIPAGDLPCVDLSLDNEEHLYWTNGLLTHNSTNFALCYGGGGNAVVRSTGVDKNEGWRIKNQFDQTYLGLKRWWGGQHRFATEHGFVTTAFGRVYPVPDIWSADGGFRSKAERNSVNGPIQGSGADIIKIAMGLAYKTCKKNNWFKLVRLVATMHDELVFEVHGSVLEEVINTLTPAMTSNAMIMGMKWPVPLTTDCEIGHDWTVSWALNEMRYREIRFDGNKKVKEPKKPLKGDDKYKDNPEAFRKAMDEYPAKKAAWEAMPYSWPEELRPLFTNLGPVEGGAPVSPPSPSPQASVPAPLPPLAEVPSQEVREPMSLSPPVEMERAMPESPAEETAAPVALANFDEDEIPAATVTESLVASGATPAPTTVSTAAPAPPVQQPPRMMKSGDTYDFVLGVPLTPGVCADLAQVIVACQSGGTKKLRLLLPDGSVLTGWSDTDCFVTPDQFYWKAKETGLIG